MLFIFCFKSQLVMFENLCFGYECVPSTYIVSRKMKAFHFFDNLFYLSGPEFVVLIYFSILFLMNGTFRGHARSTSTMKAR